MISILIRFVYVTIIILSLFFWFYFLSPLYDSIKVSNVEIATLVEKNNLKQREKEKILRLDKMVEGNDIVERVFAVLPKAEFVKQFYIEMQAMVDRIGTVPNSLTVSDDGKGTVRVSFGFVASYENFKEFLRLIETEEKLTDVQTLSFDASNIAEKKVGDTSYRGYSFSFTAQAYYKN